MKWSSAGDLDIDDSDGEESDNDVGDDPPQPITKKRVRSKVYFLKEEWLLMLGFQGLDLRQ
jgi:hypothetical protein